MATRKIVTREIVVAFGAVFDADSGIGRLCIKSGIPTVILPAFMTDTQMVNAYDQAMAVISSGIEV